MLRKPTVNTKPDQYEILGVRIDALTRAEATTQIVDRAANSKQEAVYVVKPYVEFLDPAQLTDHTRALLNNSWLSLPDGVSTQWAAAYLYDGPPSWWRIVALGAGIVFRSAAITKPIPEKFGGTRFTWQVLEAAATRGLRVYLVGSPQGGDIGLTAAAIKNRLPELKIAGCWRGQLGGMHGAALLEALATQPVENELATDLKKHKPDIILVGMGFPLQEELMAKLAPQLSHGVLIGEGGTFDYHSFGGRRPKAPEFVQEAGLEWLWRLILEPRRFGRQLAIPRFISTVYRTSKKA